MKHSKLTLSMEPEYIEQAKIYAAENNVSVSKLFKDFIKEISNKKAKKDPLLEKFKDAQISPDILALTGILKGKYPDNVDYREAYREHLLKKHGL